jgi:urease accessory protein
VRWRFDAGGERASIGAAGEWALSVAVAEIDRPESAIFAANRATGRIAVHAALLDGKTRRSRVYEDGSLRIRFPNVTDSTLEAIIVNTAGGMAGGDRFSVELTLADGASMVAGTAAAEKIYRSVGMNTDVTTTFRLGAGTSLAWLPQETILFDQARLNRRIDIELAEHASLLMCEAVVFGRAAMGETVVQGALIDRWRLSRGGKLVFAETTRLDGAVADTLAQPASANGGAALATLLIAPGDEAACAAIREREAMFAGEVGVSAWNGIAVARFCARDGRVLRHDLITVLAALKRCELPRLWLS